MVMVVYIQTRGITGLICKEGEDSEIGKVVDVVWQPSSSLYPNVFS